MQIIRYDPIAHAPHPTKTIASSTKQSARLELAITSPIGSRTQKRTQLEPMGCAPFI
jgi:hypothetical protein